MNYIIYQAYGKIDILNECLYSLYSLEEFIGDSSVVIFTDNQSYISNLAPKNLNISFRLLSNEDIISWQGKAKFVHRLKIKMLIEFSKDFSNITSNILYLDTDTKIKRNLKPLFNEIEAGKICMHMDEGKILSSKSKFEKIKKAISADQELQKIIPSSQHMWNAGVIGFNSKIAYKLSEVLSLSDTIYDEINIHSAEQLSFSIIFGKTTNSPLISAEEYIFHFWNFKEFRKILNYFFKVNANADEIKSEIQKIDVEVLIQPKRHYESLSRFKQELRKLIGRWKMPVYKK